MKEWLINRLQIPQRTVLNRKIPKKAFFTQVDLSTSEKEMLTSQIEGIYLLSVMNQQSMNIAPYQDYEFNYSEVLWVYIDLKMDKNINKVISTFHKYILNPVVLIISLPKKERILLSTSHKRLNKNNKNKVIVDQPAVTEWFNPKEKNVYSNLFNSIIVSNTSFENLFSLYHDIHQWIKCEESIQLVGLIPRTFEKREQVINMLNILRNLHKELEELYKKQKKQNDFSEKMNIYTSIQQKEKNIKSKIEKIKLLCY